MRRSGPARSCDRRLLRGAALGCAGRHAAAGGATAVPGCRVRRRRSREVRGSLAPATRPLHALFARRRAIQRGRGVRGARARCADARASGASGARDPGRNRPALRARCVDRRRAQQAGGQDGIGSGEAARAHSTRSRRLPGCVLAAGHPDHVGRGTQARRAHAVTRDQDRRRSGPRPLTPSRIRVRHQRPAAPRVRVG